MHRHQRFNLDSQPAYHPLGVNPEFHPRRIGSSPERGNLDPERSRDMEQVVNEILGIFVVFHN